MSHNFYDKSPMWPRFNHGCPKRPPEDEPYNTPYAVLGYTEAGEPVFTVHTLDGDTYEVEAGDNIIILGDTTYTLEASDDGTSLILVGSDGSTSTVPMYSALATSESEGLMSAADKAKLDGIESGAGKTGVFGIKSPTETTYTQSGNYDITKEKLGLGSVENKSASDILDELTAQDITDALGYTPADSSSTPSGGGVTGVKGDAEQSYREGNVNITKENIGLGNVQNLSPASIIAGITYQNVVDALGFEPADAKQAVNKVVKVYKHYVTVPSAGYIMQIPLSTLGSGNYYREAFFVYAIPHLSHTPSSSDFTYDTHINSGNLRIILTNGSGSDLDAEIIISVLTVDTVYEEREQG